jgi:hypothetical protein
MSIGHILYVPIVGLIGLAVGYILGAKAVRRELEAAAQKLKR